MPAFGDADSGLIPSRVKPMTVKLAFTDRRINMPRILKKIDPKSMFKQIQFVDEYNGKPKV